MKQKNSGRLAFTILSISLLTVMAGAAMAPALGVIREHFSDSSNLVVQLIVSLPALFIIVTNFFFPALCRVMKTRSIAVTGLCMYVIFGAGAFFAGNIWSVLVLRALLGVSVGMIMPLSTGLLAYYFPPEEQAHLMGLSAFMNQTGGVVATFLSGFLCTAGWNYSFLVYLLGLIALVLVVAFLPNDRISTGKDAMDSAPDSYESSEGVTVARKKPGHPAASMLRFAPSVIGMFLLMLLFFIFPTNFAITSLQGGALTPAEITLIMVGLDVVAAIIGLLFGRMMKTMPRTMKYIAPVGFTLGYALFSIGTEPVWLISGAVVIGIANGVGVPYLNTIASIKGGKDAAATVMPLLSAAMFLGQFLSPLIVSPLAGLIARLCAASHHILSNGLSEGSQELATGLLSGVTAPYIVGVVIGIIFLIQAFCTRKYQAISPVPTDTKAR